MTVIGIPGGISYKKAFCRHQKEANDRIIRRYKQIIQDALLTEIAVTFQETVGDKMEEELVKENEKLIKDGRFD